MTEGFSGKRAAEIVGITYRQLDYWARTDLVRPSLADAQGSGSRRLYSYRNLLELKVIKTLLDAGIKLESVRGAFSYLRENLGEDVASAQLVICGTSAVLVRDGQELIDVVNRTGPGRAQPAGPRRRAQPGGRRHPSSDRAEAAPAAPGRPAARRAVERRLSARAGPSTPSRPTAPAPPRSRSPTTPRRSSRRSSTSTGSMGVRAHHVRAGRGPGRLPDDGLHPGLPAAGVRLLPRGHHARTAAGHQEEPQGAAAAGAAPRDRRPHHLPAGLPPPDREVRPRRRPSSTSPPGARGPPPTGPAGIGCRGPGSAAVPRPCSRPRPRRPARLERARALAARRRAPRPRGQDGARSAAGTCRCRTRPARSPSTGPAAPARSRSTSATWAPCGSSGAGRLRPPAVGAHQRPGQDRPGPGAVHPPARRGRRLGARRHHRLVGRRRALRRDAERVEHRSRVVDAHRRHGDVDVTASGP